MKVTTIRSMRSEPTRCRRDRDGRSPQRNDDDDQFLWWKASYAPWFVFSYPDASENRLGGSAVRGAP